MIQKIFLNKHFTIISLNPYTDNSIRKAINLIKKEENSIYKLNKNQIDEIIALANGDMKQALNNLQLKTFSISQAKQNKQKDSQFSLYHTLGKFFYNKRVIHEEIRQLSCEELKQNKGKLYFDPVDLINQCQCDHQIFQLFLFENYLNYFNDIEDVVKVAQDFETAEIYNNKIFFEKNEILSDENNAYSSIFLGYSILANNYHSKNTEKKFQAIIGPKLFMHEREKKAMKESLRILLQNQSVAKISSEYYHCLKVMYKQQLNPLNEFTNKYKQKSYNQITSGQVKYLKEEEDTLDARDISSMIQNFQWNLIKLSKNKDCYDDEIENIF